MAISGILNYCGISRNTGSLLEDGWLYQHTTNSIPYVWMDSSCTTSNTASVKYCFSDGQSSTGYKEWGYTFLDKLAIWDNNGVMDVTTSGSSYLRLQGFKWEYYPPQKTLAEKLREIIESRSAPAYLPSRQSLPVPRDIREIRARETLRRVIGEQAYRGFLAKGYLSVRAKSGLFYQIFPGHGMTKVYERGGRQIERLCVVLKGDFPPTDSLITRYLLILNNEDLFRSHAISHSAINSRRLASADQQHKSLVEIYRGLKAA